MAEPEAVTTEVEGVLAGPRGVTLWLALWKVARDVARVAEDDIASLGLCLTDFAVLEALLSRGPMPVGVMASKVMLTSGSMTTAVDRLAERALVCRSVSRDDGRVRLVALTDAGRALIEPAYASHAVTMEGPFATLGATERTTLLKLLLQLRRAARAEGERP
jgi:MarR family 2-MHQ and catechol resistance regulon transcriptional repressor